MRRTSKAVYRLLSGVALAVTLVALFSVCLSGCRQPEKTDDSPRPAHAPCDRCGSRPTLTPTYEMSD
jgi:hypothetical protein